MAEKTDMQVATAATARGIAEDIVKQNAVQVEGELGDRHPLLYTYHRLLKNGDVEMWLGSIPLAMQVDAIPVRG